MKSLERYSGPARVVIDHIIPSINCGSLPVKRPFGEALTVVAHAIADGHDLLDVMLSWRRQGTRRWSESPMRDLGNDEFSGTFTPEEIGLYEFRVTGWVDAFLNWHAGFIKKSDGGDEKIGVELDIGAALIQAAANRAKGKAARELSDWAGFIGDHSRDLLQKISLVRQDDFFQKVRAYPDRSGTIQYGKRADGQIRFQTRGFICLGRHNQAPLVKMLVRIPDRLFKGSLKLCFRHGGGIRILF